MFDATVLEVFIASPTDAQKEIQVAEEAIRNWNADNAKEKRIMLKPVRWQKDATPALGRGGAQDRINKENLDPSDIVIGIFGKRAGSPTENNKISGTAGEIMESLRSSKPTLVYFSDQKYRLSDIEPEEQKRLNELKGELQKLGLYSTFENVENLREQLQSHLTRRLHGFQTLQVPAGQALAHGFFKNFIHPLHSALQNKEVRLPDYSLKGKGGEKKEVQLSFNSFQFMIMKPESLDEVNDNVVNTLKEKHRLADISIMPLNQRRPYRVYVPMKTKEKLDQAMSNNRERVEMGEVHLDHVDIFDFPTPLLALREFIEDIERQFHGGKVDENQTTEWEQQKDIQYDKFFDWLDRKKKREGLSHIDYA